MSIVITGSTGKFGLDSIEFLLEKGFPPKEIIALVRDESKLPSQFKEKGVIVKKGDYGDYQSLVSAVKGARTLLFISSNDIDKKLTQHTDVLKAAKEVGSIKHILYTSLVRKNENELSPIYFLEKAHIETEKLIRECGIGYTLLVNGLYTDCLPQYFFGPKVLETGVFFPSGQGKVNFATRRDMAEATVNIILNPDSHIGKEYILSSNEKNTIEDSTKILSELTGKSLPYISPSPQVYTETLLKFGVPKYYIDYGIGFGLAIAQGEFETDVPPNSTTLESILGRKPTTLKQYLTDYYKDKIN
eukprot:gene2317-2856_t